MQERSRTERDHPADAIAADAAVAKALRHADINAAGNTIVVNEYDPPRRVNDSDAFEVCERSLETPDRSKVIAAGRVATSGRR